MRRRYELLERAAKNSSKKGRETHHEEVISLNARQHGMYWLFLPPTALLAKMCEYLNESPVVFLVDGFLFVTPEAQVARGGNNFASAYYTVVLASRLPEG